MRPTWDKYFLGIADQVSRRASCPRAAVGAVIVSDDHHILSTGYNGAPSGEPHCLDAGCLVEDDHCQRVLHAEVNAIAWAARRGVSIEGASLYIFARQPTISIIIDMPCRECAKVVKAVGIERIHQWHVSGDDAPAFPINMR